jgi:outer membrane immunogenic protein
MTSLRSLAITAGLIVACSAVAMAADLPGPRPMAPAQVYAPTPAATWTGFYVGDYIGGGFGEAKPSDVVYGGVAYPGQGKAMDTSGLTAGLYAGYNYQIGSFVVGAETEFGYDGLSGSKLQGTAKISGVSYPLTGKDAETYDGRVRARLGYAMGNVLLFGAGGWTYGDNTLSLSTPIAGYGKPTLSQTKDINGWNLGAGAEYAMTRNIVLRGEYIYDDFGNTSYDLGLPKSSVKVHVYDNTLRLGVSYKFD